MTKIIKRSTEEMDPPSYSPTSTPKIIEREVIAAGEESRRIIETAHAQAEQVLASAQSDHDAAVQQGLQEGRERGLSEWYAETQRLSQQMKSTLDQAKPQIIRLALRVAEKIVRQRLEMSPESVVPMIDEAIRSLRAQSKIILRVHPADQTLLDSRRQRWRERNPAIGEIEIIGDEAMQRGGCKIETEFGMVDATVGTQIRVMERHLLGDTTGTQSTPRQG